MNDSGHSEQQGSGKGDSGQSGSDQSGSERNGSEKIETINALLDRMSEAADEHDPVSIGEIMHTIGQRSFGPVLLLMGLIVLAPVIGDIPGVPTIVGIMVFLVSIQLLFNREHFWLPQWLQKRSVKSSKLHKAVEHMRKPARFIDRLIKPRLTFFVKGIGPRCIALACLVIAVALPPMEVVPFSANLAGAVLTLFSLALIARDGLLALFAFILTFASVGLIVWSFI